MSDTTDTTIRIHVTLAEDGFGDDATDDDRWSVGDHVAGGHGEDRDLGAIIAIDGDRVTVAWRWSESRTTESLADLRARLARGELQAWDGYASDEDAGCECAECAAHCGSAS